MTKGSSARTDALVFGGCEFDGAGSRLDDGSGDALFIHFCGSLEVVQEEPHGGEVRSSEFMSWFIIDGLLSCAFGYGSSS